MTVVPWRAAVAAAYMLGIFGLSSLPSSTIADLGLPASLWNLAHVPLFAGLAWVALWALVGPPLGSALVAALACLIFAATDEWHQSWVPGRVLDLADLLADGAGILLGIGAFALLPSGWRAARERTGPGGQQL